MMGGYRCLLRMLTITVYLYHFICCAIGTGRVSESNDRIRNIPIHWIILHYHKTGNYLSNSLLKPFEKKNISIISDSMHKRKLFDPTLFYDSNKSTPSFGDIDSHRNLEYHYPIIISHAGNFLFDWNKVLTKNGHVQYRVAHMVRDPYDMVLSGLLYHSQDQMPEGWLGNKINPCLENTQDMNQFLVTISRHPCGPDLKILQSYIRNIQLSCKIIHKKYTTNNYYRTLRAMMGQGHVTEALQMETSRAILSGDICGADLLRMAANTVNENNANAVMRNTPFFKRFWMSSFPLNNSKVFYQSAERFYNFLTQDTQNGQFWDQKIDLSEEYISLLGEDELLSSLLDGSYSVTAPRGRALNAAYSFRGRNFFKSPPRQRTLGAKSNVNKGYRGMVWLKKEENTVTKYSVQRHITRDILSAASRAKYLEELKNDDVFSPLLNLISDVLHHRGGTKDC